MRSSYIGQVCLAAAVLLAGASLARAQTPAATDAGKLKVTVEYKGQSAAVDKDHKIWIWVFDTPTITADSSPLAMGSLTENKTSYKFMALPKTVYLAAAFDEKGGYDGNSGPPPSGTPVIVHGGAGPGSTATAISTGGEDTVVTITFDDTVRMP
jgi:uncharacterized protein (DUF2141 family)